MEVARPLSRRQVKRYKASPVMQEGTKFAISTVHINKQITNPTQPTHPAAGTFTKVSSYLGDQSASSRARNKTTIVGINMRKEGLRHPPHLPSWWANEGAETDGRRAGGKQMVAVSSRAHTPSPRLSSRWATEGAKTAERRAEGPP